jgi:hypothetical protein
LQHTCGRIGSAYKIIFGKPKEGRLDGRVTTLKVGFGGRECLGSVKAGIFLMMLKNNGASVQ